MKSMSDLKKLVEFLQENKIQPNFPPNGFMLFLSKDDRLDFLKPIPSLGSAPVAPVHIPNTNIECDILIYGGKSFYIVSAY